MVTREHPQDVCDATARSLQSSRFLDVGHAKTPQIFCEATKGSSPVGSGKSSSSSKS
jgi:hypothetical protein